MAMREETYSNMDTAAVLPPILPQLQQPSISLPRWGARRPRHTISPAPQDHHSSSSRLPFIKALQKNPLNQHRSATTAHPQVRATIFHLPSPNQVQEQPTINLFQLRGRRKPSPPLLTKGNGTD